MDLDEVDLKIINILKENSRASFSEIARELKLSRQTVKARIERLEKEGIIVKYTVKLSPSIEESGSIAYLLVNAESQEIMRDIEKIVEVNRVTSKRYLIRVILNDLSELNEIVERGIEIVEVIPVIDRDVKERPFRTKVTFRCDYCGKEMTDEPIIYKFRNKLYVFCCRTCLREFKEMVKKEG